MNQNLKKMISYYKPYRAVFAADMLFATLSAAVALTIPLVVRYVTSTLIYQQPQMMLRKLFLIGIGLFVLLALDCYSRFFIGNYGHVMGAKMEYDMRAELFGHLQKLSFSFYDDAKVGQLMSRVTADLFDITELLHHGPENIILSVLKIVGAFVILLNINGWLALAAFAVLPVMFVFAFALNKRMRRAFQQNRIKIAEINEQIEDNLSGIRVVKSFANEAIENEKFRHGNDGFLAAKKNSYHYMGSFQAGVGVFTTLIQVNVILAGGVLIAKGMVTVNDLVTFLLYIGVFTDPIRTLVDFTEQFQNGYTGFERFQEIMNIEPEIQDANDAVALTDVKGTIDFENVSFQYKDNQEKVLNRINLHSLQRQSLLPLSHLAFHIVYFQKLFPQTGIHPAAPFRCGHAGSLTSPYGHLSHPHGYIPRLHHRIAESGNKALSFRHRMIPPVPYMPLQAHAD